MKITVCTELDGTWVLSRQNDSALPVEAIKAALSREFGRGVSFESETLTSLCCCIIRELTAEEAADAAARLISEAYETDVSKNESSTDGDAVIRRVGGFALIRAQIVSGCDGDIDAAMKSISDLIGWDAFKSLCDELVTVSAEVKKRETYESFTFQNYLFSVNDGCGLSTALRLFSQLVKALALFEFSGDECVEEITLSTRSSDGKQSASDVIEYLSDKRNSGKLICLDIGEFMEKSRHNDLKSLLTKLVPLENCCIFAFRIPFVEPDALEGINKVLSDVLFMRSIPVVPFTNRQLRSCAELTLKKYGFAAETMVWDVFFSRLCEEKSDGRFYGVQSVKKIVYEMLWLKHKAQAQKKAQTDGAADNGGNDGAATIIQRDEILSLSPTYSKKPKNGFDELGEMIGMEKIAERLREIVAQVKISLENEKMERPCLHMRFVGAPGTGKTTVARIVGRIFAENGILRNGYFFEYTARELCGEYVGQTAPKTSSICRDAYGSVLFIDEAYALYTGEDRGTDYGREALTTLISEMENHRDDMVVVMAGYSKDMDLLMEGNAGLRSRMPFMLEFKSYTRDQLFDIYMLMVKKHFKSDASLKSAAKEYFSSLADDYINSQDFANARFARNLYERTWSKGAMRAQMAGEKAFVLTADDFRAAAAEKEFSEKIMTKHTLGFAPQEKE